MRPTGEVGRIVWRWFGQGILRWRRTSSEECKVECPIVCPQSKIAQLILGALECSCQHGKHGRRGPTSNLFGEERERISFSAVLHQEYVVCHSSLQRRAMVRSQSGPLSSVPSTAMPTNRVTQFEAEQFRVLLGASGLLDALGHHRAACSRSGVLGRRGFVVESAVAQIAGKAVHECPPT